MSSRRPEEAQNEPQEAKSRAEGGGEKTIRKIRKTTENAAGNLGK